MRAANDGLRFLLELCVLASICYWGFKTGHGALRWVLGLGTPILLAVVWTLSVNPNGSLAVRDPPRLVLELAIFGAGVAALTRAGHSCLALVLGIVVFLHLALTFPLDRR